MSGHSLPSFLPPLLDSAEPNPLQFHSIKAVLEQALRNLEQDRSWFLLNSLWPHKSSDKTFIAERMVYAIPRNQRAEFIKQIFMRFSFKKVRHSIHHYVYELLFIALRNLEDQDRAFQRKKLADYHPKFLLKIGLAHPDLDFLNTPLGQALVILKKLRPENLIIRQAQKGRYVLPKDPAISPLTYKKGMTDLYALIQQSNYSDKTQSGKNLNQAIQNHADHVSDSSLTLHLKYLNPLWPTESDRTTGVTGMTSHLSTLALSDIDSSNPLVTEIAARINPDNPEQYQLAVIKYLQLVFFFADLDLEKNSDSKSPADLLFENTSFHQKSCFALITSQLENTCWSLSYSLSQIGPVALREKLQKEVDFEQLSLCPAGVKTALESIEICCTGNLQKRLVKDAIDLALGFFIGLFDIPHDMEVHMDQAALAAYMGLHPGALYHTDSARLNIAPQYFKSIASLALANFRSLKKDQKNSWDHALDFFKTPLLLNTPDISQKLNFILKDITVLLPDFFRRSDLPFPTRSPKEKNTADLLAYLSNHTQEFCDLWLESTDPLYVLDPEQEEKSGLNLEQVRAPLVLNLKNLDTLQAYLHSEKRALFEGNFWVPEKQITDLYSEIWAILVGFRLHTDPAVVSFWQHILNAPEGPRLIQETLALANQEDSAPVNFDSLFWVPEGASTSAFRALGSDAFLSQWLLGKNLQHFFNPDLVPDHAESRLNQALKKLSLENPDSPENKAYRYELEKLLLEPGSLPYVLTQFLTPSIYPGSEYLLSHLQDYLRAEFIIEVDPETEEILATRSENITYQYASLFDLFDEVLQKTVAPSSTSITSQEPDSEFSETSPDPSPDSDPIFIFQLRIRHFLDQHLQIQKDLKFWDLYLETAGHTPDFILEKETLAALIHDPDLLEKFNIQNQKAIHLLIYFLTQQDNYFTDLWLMTQLKFLGFVSPAGLLLIKNPLIEALYDYLKCALNFKEITKTYELKTEQALNYLEQEIFARQDFMTINLIKIFQAFNHIKLLRNYLIEQELWGKLIFELFDQSAGGLEKKILFYKILQAPEFYELKRRVLLNPASYDCKKDEPKLFPHLKALVNTLSSDEKSKIYQNSLQLDFWTKAQKSALIATLSPGDLIISTAIKPATSSPRPYRRDSLALLTQYLEEGPPAHRTSAPRTAETSKTSHGAGAPGGPPY